MDNNLKIVIVLCLTALLLGGGITSCVAYESHLVANSPDPLATRCAIGAESHQLIALCPLIAAQRGKP